MSDSPPRDPKIADAAAPNADPTNASGATGANAARAPLSSNLQYLMKQPSTPWMTFDRDSKAAAVESALDAAWGEEGAPGEAVPPPRPLPPAPPMPLGEVKFLFDSSAPPADVKAPLGTASAPAEVKVPVDVPPPPAHLMAVVDQVLAQSRPPPADPGPANSPRTNLEWPVSALHSSSSVATSPVLDLAPRTDVAAPAHNTAHADAGASAPYAAPTYGGYGAPHGSLETSGELAPAKKSGALLYAALGGGALVVIGVVVVAFIALRSPPDKSASSAMSAATNTTALSVAIAPSASAPPDSVTAPITPTSPKASASVAAVEDLPAVAASAPSSASSIIASATAPTPPASPIDPKTGAKRASYLTIPRAVSRHHIFLDGKLMLGSGARSFPVKCGEHTLAIDDRKAPRAINVTCGGEYVVTN